MTPGHRAPFRAAVRILLLAGLPWTGACFVSRPMFREPQWGDAPPPLPLEVTEITSERRRCARACGFERYVLRRDGRALHEYFTGKTLDSAWYGVIDSATFARLARDIQGPMFSGASGDNDRHVPLANDSWVFSLATLCRRRVVATARLDGPYQGLDTVITAIVVASGTVNWHGPAQPVRY